MANERTEPLQLNLGSLRSAMSLTLHTHHASRIWHGRAPTEGRPGIIGLNGFIGAMRYAATSSSVRISSSGSVIVLPLPFADAGFR